MDGSVCRHRAAALPEERLSAQQALSSFARLRQAIVGAWTALPLPMQVVRIAVLALRNLLAAPGLDYGPDMVEAGLPKVVQQRQLQARTRNPQA